MTAWPVLGAVRSIPISFRVAGVLSVFLLSASALPDTLSPNQIKQLAQGANRDVIVILRDQMPNLPAVRGARTARAAALAEAQSPILSICSNREPPRYGHSI
jgi:hypothetical protein